MITSDRGPTAPSFAASSRSCSSDMVWWRSLVSFGTSMKRPLSLKKRSYGSLMCVSRMLVRILRRQPFGPRSRQQIVVGRYKDQQWQPISQQRLVGVYNCCQLDRVIGTGGMLQQQIDGSADD